MLFKDHFHQQLNDKISKCDACQLKNNPGPVAGHGSLDADVMIIGDAPKPSDLTAMIPFTGKSKDRLDRAINKADLKKEDYYLTYMVKHILSQDVRPDTLNNRYCLDLLLEEIELINPRIIFCAGYYVSTALIKEYKIEHAEESLQKIHGDGLLIPAIIKHKKIIRPKRYLIPGFSPTAENEIIRSYFEIDFLTIKHIQDLWITLLD